MFSLETPRLLFRELTPDDYADVASVFLYDEIMRKMSTHASEALVNRWLGRKLEQYREFGYSHWHVSLKETGEFAGIIGIAPENVEGVENTWLAELVKKEHQRKGYAFEGAQVRLVWVFRNLHPDKIIAEVDETNLPSRRLAEKPGMSPERTYLRFNGEAEISHVLYSIGADVFFA